MSADESNSPKNGDVSTTSDSIIAWRNQELMARQQELELRKTEIESGKEQAKRVIDAQDAEGKRRHERLMWRRKREPWMRLITLGFVALVVFMFFDFIPASDRLAFLKEVAVIAGSFFGGWGFRYYWAEHRRKEK